jgi:CDP-4-dehydro-6-deoxyglucose reductase
MARLLSLTRAARLVGARRGALQGMIQRGELAAFEGMVSEEELLRAFPQANFTEDPSLERIERLKDAAYSRRLRERVLPSTELLVARLTEVTRDLARAQAQSKADRDTMWKLRAHLRELADGEASREAIAELLAWLDRSFEPAPVDEAAPGLIAKERLLRIMSAHVQVRPSGHEFFVEGNDTLLEAALRAGLSVDYGCSGGGCGKCRAKVVSGEVQKVRHSDYALTASEKAEGVVLMCCNTAVADLVIEAREALGAADMPLQSIEAKVKSVAAMGEEMRLVHLQTPRSNRLRFLAGQSVRLALPGGAAKDLPVASCPCDDRNLHFHVPQHAGDAFCEGVFSALAAGDSVRVDGPRGDFVLNEDSTRPLAFIAADTGFAPVKSLIEHAMALESAPAIHLAWIASRPGGHYLDNLCRSWREALDDFHYSAVTAEGDLESGPGAQRALEAALEGISSADACDYYVSGPAPFLAAAEFFLLERGVPRSQLRLAG